MLTDKQIEQAKKQHRAPGALFEHNDCIRIAYEWLDAQKKIKSYGKTQSPLKHLIENWGGRYVSQSDVEVAAFIHPDIKGKYPHFNLSAKFVEPSEGRLRGIGEAFSQNYREHHRPGTYSIKE